MIRLQNVSVTSSDILKELNVFNIYRKYCMCTLTTPIHIHFFPFPFWVFILFFQDNFNHALASTGYLIAQEQDLKER